MNLANTYGITPLTITRDAAVDVIRKAYSEETLSAQAKNVHVPFYATSDSRLRRGDFRGRTFGLRVADSAPAAYYAEARSADTGEVTKTYTCAIGALYPLDDALSLQTAYHYGLASELNQHGVLLVDDIMWFRNIQSLHDQWASANHEGEGFSVEEAMLHEMAFVNALHKLTDDWAIKATADIRGRA